MLPDRVRLAGGLACVLALSAEWGRGAEGGPFPPPPPTSELALRAPDGRLEQAFARARSWALSLVVTNGYVAHDPEPRVMHALTPDRAADLTRPLYDRDAKGEWIKAVDPRNGLEGYRASKPVPAYWGTYAPSTRPNTQGTPWSGRECFCARDIAHSVVGAHLLGLDRENLAMLRLFAKGANENTFGNNYGWPKWSYSFFGEPFYMDADWRELAMPYDIGLRCWELYRWTGQPDYLRDEDMFRFQLNLHTKFQDLPEADRTPLVSQTSKTFWDLQDQNGNGIAEEHIQLATYWEDNNDKVRLIEAGDSFSNQVRSLENLARVLEARGEPDRARPYQDRAAALRRLFHEKWYSHPDRLYIRAFDETGAPRVNWGHESSFLMLADNLTDNGPRAAAYADFIAEQLFRYGINIEATTYLPEIFYGRGRNELGWYWLQHVVKYLGPDNAGPYPETAFLLVSNVVTGLMGLQGEMQEQAFRTTPRLTAALPWAEIDHVPVGSSDLKVRHDGNTKTTATLNRGPNLTWCAGFLGIHPQLKVNGRAMAAKPRLLQGLMVSEIRVPLARGATVVVEVPAEEPGYVALGDLAATSTRGAWSKDASPRNNGSELLLLGWRAFERGLSAQPEAAATYALDGGFSRLTAMAGLDSGSAAGGAGRLTIKVDGKEVFNSGILKAEND